MTRVLIVENHTRTRYAVWLGDREDNGDGVCLAVADTERAALQLALDELNHRAVYVLERLYPRPKARRKARRRAPR